ncbi:MAG: L-serine ammonia-lyase, iron-sulfur-dependent subunit beta [Clostridia bacterium]|nr:L-serine ammonia-lyase, iron-sulfur-dependent subunit beta [Clostridia bacterium]
MNLFNIIGPVMIGPSSSHTAGACRIGYISRALLGQDVKTADIGLHGSFAKTYVGHGTDRAVAGGLQGMREDDPLLRQSLKIAAGKGITFRFYPITLKGAHPNTLLMDLTGVGGEKLRVQASSVGGGAILVNTINGMEVDLQGESPTIVIRHKDLPGVIAGVSGILSERGQNIASMRVYRRSAGGDAIMALEMDAVPPEEVLARLRELTHIHKVVLLGRL